MMFCTVFNCVFMWLRVWIVERVGNTNLVLGCEEKDFSADEFRMLLYWLSKMTNGWA